MYHIDSCFYLLNNFNKSIGVLAMQMKLINTIQSNIQFLRLSIKVNLSKSYLTALVVLINKYTTIITSIEKHLFAYYRIQNIIYPSSKLKHILKLFALNVYIMRFIGVRISNIDGAWPNFDLMIVILTSIICTGI